MTETVTATQGEIVEPVAKPRKRGNGALVKAEAAPAPVAAPQGDAMLALFERMARDPSVDPARIEQFLEMRRTEEDRRAQRAFNAAMAAAKAEFEPIVKRHLVDYVNKTGGRTTYKHEDLADIENAVRPALSAHGLSYRFRGTSTPEAPVSVTCVISHSDGHFEETTLHAGADNTGGKNSIQAIGSAIRYLQRYTLTLGLGLAAGRDDDGRAADQKPADRITEKQVADLNAMLQKTDEPAANVQILFEHWKINDLSELTPDQYRKTVAQINKKLGVQA